MLKGFIKKNKKNLVNVHFAVARIGDNLREFWLIFCQGFALHVGLFDDPAKDTRLV